MDKQTRKVKLIYSGELLIFAIVFLVIGILQLLAVIKLSVRFQLIFKILTLCGATWMVADFIWVLVSPKRKKKNCIMDKAMMLPLALYLYTFDIVGFILRPGYGYYQVGVPAVFIYICCVYTFQSIYHYFKPTPAILEAIAEIQKADEEETKETPVEETPVETPLEEPVEQEKEENKEEQ